MRCLDLLWREIFTLKDLEDVPFLPIYLIKP